ncbi:hypothetical protein ORV05_25415 [Amycolatopsis cynarae]|uniref:Uncharacterized protein n=1 Tax=Amycolatopsis cynarae TaxID=2995223 RepID=A0ABY7AWA0_9PSEU|nr:hypothetical protein [Amycolatopsis sp. HUAS 11-8]WAL64292.1 hypothetical protein ORV05_25415 [Amycolatopsis sp. HUAS 11-8]
MVITRGSRPGRRPTRPGANIFWSAAGTATSDSAAPTSNPGQTPTSGYSSSSSSRPATSTTTATEKPTSSTSQEPTYEDGKGIDFGNGYGVLVIACAAGQPTGVTSPDFDIVDGPYQEEQDGRYWDYLVQLHDGKLFADKNIWADWKCGGEQPGGSASGGGAPVPPVAGSADAKNWQKSNGGKAQVAYAPKSGVETGFGGTAQG